MLLNSDSLSSLLAIVLTCHLVLLRSSATETRALRCTRTMEFQKVSKVSELPREWRPRDQSLWLATQIRWKQNLGSRDVAVWCRHGFFESLAWHPIMAPMPDLGSRFMDLQGSKRA